MSSNIEYYPQFFTATILEWRELLKNDKYKEIILSSLQFLVSNKRIAVYGFVIMPNHIHLVWRINNDHKRENVQRDFLKYTAQHIRWDLVQNNPGLLEQFRVNAKDRMFQVWERNPLSINIYSETVMLQKLNYIHTNPLQEKWKLCSLQEDYPWSSARFYHTGEQTHSFLTHFRG